MNGFKITTPDNQEIKFQLYLDAAPVTSKAFVDILPFTRTFHHARVSGQEIWIDNVPQLDIIQENASIFTEPGEVVFGPAKPSRTKTANCFGIYYGEGKGLDACNIFARVIKSDRQKLIDLGNNIWKNGSQDLTIAAIDII
jgi:2',3'-cyclic-nucleotide 2'-phosphodiesterase (5'-nucleotidase family)